MKIKKQVKKIKKAVEKNPLLFTTVVTGAMAVLSTAGMMMEKKSEKKSRQGNSVSM